MKDLWGDALCSDGSHCEKMNYICTSDNKCVPNADEQRFLDNQKAYEQKRQAEKDKDLLEQGCDKAIRDYKEEDDLSRDAITSTVRHSAVEILCSRFWPERMKNLWDWEKQRDQAREAQAVKNIAKELAARAIVSGNCGSDITDSTHSSTGTGYCDKAKRNIASAKKLMAEANNTPNLAERLKLILSAQVPMGESYDDFLQVGTDYIVKSPYWLNKNAAEVSLMNSAQKLFSNLLDEEKRIKAEIAKQTEGQSAPVSPKPTSTPPPGQASNKTDALRENLREKLLGQRVNVGDAATCDASIRPQIKDIDKTIEVLRKEEPKDSVGPQVEVGSCSSRLRKLYGNFLIGPTFANTAANWEKRSCLELKKNYLRNACECSKRGLTFSADEALQDQTLEAYSAVQKLERKARDKGIRNPIINKIVTEAAGVRDCFNIGTMESLRKTGKTLESIVGP